MYITLFVLDDPDRLDDVLAALEDIGVRGVTILESTGMHRMRRKIIPMRYVSSFVNMETSHLTLFAMVQDEAQAHACLAAIESIIGNLDEPNTGVFAAWPIAFVKGLPEPEESDGLD